MSLTGESFATMLLTMSLSPNKEEYARPMSAQEFLLLRQSLHETNLSGLSALCDLTISELMVALNLSEEEAFRVYTLLHRDVQLSFMLDKLAMEGISAIAVSDPAYPSNVRTTLKEATPPVLYAAGEIGLSQLPAVAIMGIGGVKTSPDLRDAVTDLVQRVTALGYAVITGGEPGVSRIAANAVAECGGMLVDIPGGAMLEHTHGDPVNRLLRNGQALVLCMEHPEALFTVSHAIARNKIIFAMANAAFVCNTDNKRGEIDALHKHTCEWIYAWTGCPANGALVSKGAIPTSDFRKMNIDLLSRRWKKSTATQISMFDI